MKSIKPFQLTNEYIQRSLQIIPPFKHANDEFTQLLDSKSTLLCNLDFIEPSNLSIRNFESLHIKNNKLI